MSIPFSDTDTYRGLVQLYEKEIGQEYGHVSNNPTRLKAFAADVCNALDEYLGIAIRSSGKWQFDDTGHSKLPIIYHNTVAGQQDYEFVLDEESNLILDVHRVFVKDGASLPYRELSPVDAQNDPNVSGLWDELGTQGSPQRYDKTGQSIFLDPAPSASVTKGLKVFVNRESDYFIYTDTSKKAGIPGHHHRLLFLRPALDEARRNNLSNYALVEREVVSLIGDESRGIIGSVQKYFAERNKDTKPRLTANIESNK